RLEVSDSGLKQVKRRGAVGGAADSGQSDRRRDCRREDEQIGAQVAVHAFTLLSRPKPQLAGISNFNPVFAQEAMPAALSCQTQLALAVVGWQARVVW